MSFEHFTHVYMFIMEKLNSLRTLYIEIHMIYKRSLKYVFLDFHLLTSL